jgi:ketosteroid isomerase-like protein
MPEESTIADLTERTRAIFEAMDRDWDIDALAANWVPDIVWDMSQSVLGTLHGRAAVREFLESWWATWEDHHHHIEEFAITGTAWFSLRCWKMAAPWEARGACRRRMSWCRGGSTARPSGSPPTPTSTRPVLPPNASPTSGPMVEESATPDVFALMRSAFEAFNHRDFDVIPKIFAPDAVYDLSSTGLGIYEGIAEIRALFEEWWSAYDELDSELEEVVDLRNGVAFVALLQKGRPGRQHGGRTTTTGMGHGG